MEKIVENVRIHNIHALLVIGGFEVRGQLPGSKRGGGDPRVWAAEVALPEAPCAGYLEPAGLMGPPG